MNEAVIADDHAAVIATNSASEPDSFRANGVKENIKTAENAAAIEIASRKRKRPTAKRPVHGSGNEGPRSEGYVCPTKINGALLRRDPSLDRKTIAGGCRLAQEATLFAKGNTL